MSAFRIYNSDNIDELDWSSYHDGIQSQRYLEPLVKNGVSSYITNSSCELMICAGHQLLLPLVLSSNSKNQTYVVSNNTQFIDYPLEEIVQGSKYPKYVKIGSRLFFALLKMIGRLSRFDNCVFVNNWLVSTNLYPQLSKEVIDDLMGCLSAHFPKKTIVFKGLLREFNAGIMDALAENNCKEIVTRQVYMMDPALKKYKKKRPYTQDKKHAEKSEGLQWSVQESLSDEEKSKIIAMYTDLYIRKYSVHNPHYTPSFLSLLLHKGVMTLHVLKENERIQASQLIFTLNGMLTTPMIGYDAQEPKEKGLYRLMNMALMQEAIEKNFVLNMSSGASSFKKQRGGVPVFEHNMVKYNHVGPVRRLPWLIFKMLSDKVVKPGMEKYEV